MLEAVFFAVEDYVADPELRTGAEDIDADQLRDAVHDALAALRAGMTVASAGVGASECADELLSPDTAEPGAAMGSTVLDAPGARRA